MKGSKWIDVGQVAQDLVGNTEHFCRHFFPNGRKSGNYWQMGDVSGANGQSLSIRLRPVGTKKAGKWIDHATGDYGDLLDLLGHRFPFKSYGELLAEATSYLGHRPVIVDQLHGSGPAEFTAGRSSKSGARLFGYGRRLSGTPAEHYLRQRGITRFGPALAYHPSAYLRGDDGQRCEYPALLAAITDNTGQITGCSRIFLAGPSGQIASIENSKRVLGDLFGNGVRFGPWQFADDLIIGEGLENTLSVGTAFATAALISCLTANHLAAFNWPSHAQRIWIAHDNDDAGERGAKQLATRVEASGRQSYPLGPVRGDFNEDLVIDGVTALRRRLSAMIDLQAPEHDLWPGKQAA